MAAYHNVSGGVLVLPDGAQVADGDAVEIADTDNVAIAQWIKGGMLEPDRAPDKPKPVEQRGGK